jgi:circadian clock protein KaiC
VRLASMMREVGAKRVAIDTAETLFAGPSDEAILRAKLRRRLRWLEDKGVTAVITGERGQSSLSRHGLEEYVSDSVTR